jgi:hypothetical protein
MMPSVRPIAFQSINSAIEFGLQGIFHGVNRHGWLRPLTLSDKVTTHNFTAMATARKSAQASASSVDAELDKKYGGTLCQYPSTES